jgi:cobyrinic acid a,c-diamide synthase
LEVDRENPYYPVRERIKGHEFHYSRAEPVGDTKEGRLVFHVHRGCGMVGRRDGFSRKNLLATYTHVHGVGCPSWARSFYGASVIFAKKRIFDKKDI